ncbi:cytochrome P450 [Paenibacillus hunanensis]|uniref:cytochrome P450 n=1 Tax=Paenibacillus hunanensis TaxID=539262 RepID=UPI002A6B4C18|nr:cytochrome P450 [Paenibacillus hunanensis]WPP40040.1 cytochrome P450 [Paenibacillus hunanensis]
MQSNSEASAMLSPNMIVPQGVKAAGSAFAWYEKMRREAPVHYDEQRGSWDVFRYEDVHRVMSDYKSFSSQTRRGADGQQSDMLLMMDPPKHKKYRAIVNKAFTPKAVAAMEPRIAEITNQLLDQVQPDKSMDIIHDLSFPLPVIVIAELLGVREEDRTLFKGWSDTLVEGFSGKDESPQQLAARKQQASRELYQYFMGVIEQRKAQPQHDLVSALLAAEVEGEKLDIPHLLSFCLLLLVAGNETTTNLIGNAVICLTEQPGRWQQLARNRELLDTAIEEALRFRSPVQGMVRKAVEDIEIGSQIIRRDQLVTAWMGSANRDEQKFEAADEYRIDRHPNPHMAFGMGVHFCLGAPLARLEARTALNVLLDRFPDLQAIEGQRLELLPSPMVYGVKSLPVQPRP